MVAAVEYRISCVTKAVEPVGGGVGEGVGEGEGVGDGDGDGAVATDIGGGVSSEPQELSAIIAPRATPVFNLVMQKGYRIGASLMSAHAWDGMPLSINTAGEICPFHCIMKISHAFWVTNGRELLLRTYYG